MWLLFVFLPSWLPDFSCDLALIAEVVNGDQVEDQVDQHQSQDGNVEEYHPLVSNLLNKARRHPHIWFPLWPIRKSDIQAQDHSCQESSKTPGYDGETEELGEVRASPGDGESAEGPGEIQTDDGHPSKHGNADKVTKVSKDDTEDGAGQSDIVDNEDVDCNQEDACNVADDNLAMEVE